jgi:hypothetical protein
MARGSSRARLGRNVVVDALVMIVHSYRQHFLGMFLTHNKPIQIVKDLQKNKQTSYPPQKYLLNATHIIIRLL